MNGYTATGDSVLTAQDLENMWEKLPYRNDERLFEIIITKLITQIVQVSDKDGLHILIHPATWQRLQYDLDKELIRSPFFGYSLGNYWGIPVFEDDQKAIDLLRTALEVK